MRRLACLGAAAGAIHSQCNSSQACQNNIPQTGTRRLDSHLGRPFIYIGAPWLIIGIQRCRSSADPMHILSSGTLRRCWMRRRRTSSMSRKMRLRRAAIAVRSSSTAMVAKFCGRRSGKAVTSKATPPPPGQSLHSFQAPAAFLPQLLPRFTMLSCQTATPDFKLQR
jgi:hypothetical protein